MIDIEATIVIHLHIAAGLTALVFGTLALISGKGGTLHRRSGTVFVYAMMVMALLGAVVGAYRSQPMNVVAGSLTFYLVATALLTVRRPAWAFPRVDWVAAWFAVLLGVSSLCALLTGLIEPTTSAVPVVIFGTVALLAGIADFRVMRRKLVGRPRIARHLWRMGLAFWIATASFFLGQAKVFPDFVRTSGLLPVPVVLVLGAVVYWIVRVSFMKRRKATWESAEQASPACRNRRR